MKANRLAFQIIYPEVYIYSPCSAIRLNAPQNLQPFRPSTTQYPREISRSKDRLLSMMKRRRGSVDVRSRKKEMHVIVSYVGSMRHVYFCRWICYRMSFPPRFPQLQTASSLRNSQLLNHRSLVAGRCSSHHLEIAGRGLHDTAATEVTDLGWLLNLAAHDGGATEVANLGVGAWGGLDSGHGDCGLVWVGCGCL